MYTSAHNNDPEQRETDTTHFHDDTEQQQHAQHGYSYNDDDDDDDRHAQRGAGLSGANGDVSAFRLDGDEADGDDDGEMGGEEEERGWKRKPKRAQKRAVAKELKRKERRVGDQEGDEDDGDDEEHDEESGIQSGPLMGLPLETLARIFAHLDPVSLARCAAVCQTFAAVARDDATWRQAFSVHFHIERRASGLGGGDDTTTTTTPVLRRLDASSWKQEYTKRTELLRQWRKAKSPTVISDARVSTIDAVAVSLPHHFMLSASLTYGVASRCDPFTGKVAKGFVDAAGQVNGAGFGPMAVDPSLDISSVALESDASRIVWGFHSGQVGMTVLQKQGTNPRGAIKATRFSDRGCHAGPVLDIAMPFGTGRGGAHSIERKPERLKQRQAALGEVAETFVTAGLDGTVRLWSPRRVLPVWTALALPKKEGPHRPTPVVCVDYDVGSGSIAAGTSEGDVVVWTAIDVDALLRLPATAWDPVLVASSSQDEEVPSVVQARAALQRIQSSVVKVMLGRTRSAAPSGATKAVSQLILDVDPSAESALVRLLVLGKGAHAFERIDISFSQANVSGSTHEVQRAMFENPAESEVTSLRPDFDLAPRRTPRSSATPTSPSLGPASSGANHHHLVLGPSPDSSPSPEAALFAERKYVCAGTKNGRVVFWDWRNRLGDDETFVPASLSLDAHHTSITALDLTEHVVVVGCSDGTIKAFCPLTGSLVRTFNDRTATRHPARMLAAGELSDDEASRFVVTSLVAGTETIVAAIGAQVLAWRAEKVKGSGSNKRGPRSSSGTPKLGARTASGRHWQSQREMEHDVYETKAQLQAEQESRQASYERYRYAVGPPEIGGLSEQEAFEYAMMLSRDEEEARRRQGAAAGTSAFPRRLAENVGKGKQRSDAQEDEEPIDWELEDALEQIALAESRPRTRQTSDEEGDAAAAGHNSTTSPSPSPSPMSSPPLGGISTPSRAWDILNNAGSLARASQQGEERWRPNNKVRTVNVPRAARLSSGAAASLSSMENGPLGGSSSSSLRRGSHTGANNVDWSSPTDFPAFSSPSGPASLAASPGAGMGAGSLPGSHPRPQGAWAQGSPALRPAASSSSSSSAGLSASRPSFSPLPPPKSPVGGQQGNPSPPPARPSEAMDDDLRFAIELSLAEARSK